jgi:HEAT repeat protein
MGVAGKPAAPALVEQLATAIDGKSNGSKERCQQITGALRKIGAGADAVPVLRNGLKQKDRAQRHAVIEAIAELGPDAKPLAPDLTALFTVAEDRDAATSTLAKIGREVVDDLTTALDKINKDMKLGAIQALDKMGPEAREKGTAVSALLKIIKNDRDAEVRIAANAALKKVQMK